jgi:hypothetical protein
MALHTDDPDRYAKTWFYVTLASVVLYGLVVFVFVFRS